MNSNRGQGLIAYIAPADERGARKPPLVRERTPVLRGCSACAGEYEDPDRTVASHEEEADEESSEPGKDFRKLKSGLRN
jgi:hypothetical protein